MARITQSQRIEAIETQIAQLAELVAISLKAEPKTEPKTEKAKRKPVTIPVLPFTDKFPSMAQIEKALLPDQCQHWKHSEKAVYRDGKQRQILQCNRDTCKHVAGQFDANRTLAQYHKERANYHARWNKEFGPATEKAGK